MTARTPKIQRWMDLLAELLARNYPVSLEELTERMPAYRAAPSKEARRRMFERDKDELKAVIAADRSATASHPLKEVAMSRPFVHRAGRR